MSTEAQARKASRREHEAQQRRREILKAARTLFVEKGIRNTTLDEIAETAAFGKGTIYNYFSSKEELFREIIYDLTDEIFEETRLAMEAAGPDLRTQLEAYAVTMIREFHEHKNVTLMLLREHHQLDQVMLEQFATRFQQTLQIVVEPLAAEMRAGRIREYDPQVLMLLFDGMIRTHCMTASHGMWPDTTQAPVEVARLLVSVFFDGITNQPYSG